MLRTAPTDPSTAGSGSSDVAGGADPGLLLTDWLARAGRPGSRLQPRLLRTSDGHLMPLDVDRWAGPVTPADDTLLARAEGPVLDAGCGPGRLTAALHERGVSVLGVDVLDPVPVLARRAGAPVHVGDVFGPLPGEGRWRTVLLADGNIGIGGDPSRVLRRVRALLRPAGTALVELHPAQGERSGAVRLEGIGVSSAWFPWALLGPDALDRVARTAGFAVRERWSADGRPFAALACA